MLCSRLARRVFRALVGATLLILVIAVAATLHGAAPRLKFSATSAPETREVRTLVAAAVRPSRHRDAAPPAEARAEPAEQGKPATCAPDAATPIPEMVASIFRCRLTEAGLPAEEVDLITAEAVTIAACESEFDPNAVVFDGRYLHRPHPATGSFYSAAGIFQFIRDHADRWISGGYANVTDPVANIDAAARLYLHNARRGYPGWSDWACAAANDGFRATSVLPGWPGGPARLPDWAYTY